MEEKKLLELIEQFIAYGKNKLALNEIDAIAAKNYLYAEFEIYPSDDVNISSFSEDVNYYVDAMTKHINYIFSELKMKISNMDRRLEEILFMKVFTIFKLFSLILAKKVLISCINTVLSSLLIKNRKIILDKIPANMIIIKNKYFFF